MPPVVHVEEIPDEYGETCIVRYWRLTKTWSLDRGEINPELRVLPKPITGCCMEATASIRPRRVRQTKCCRIAAR